MHRARNSALLAILLLLIAPIARAAEAAGMTCASDHILVHFKPEARALLTTAAFPGQLTALLARLSLPAGCELQETPLARMLRARAVRASRAGQDSIDLDRFLYLRLPAGFEVADCLRLLENHPFLDYAEPDGIGRCAETIPDDPNFPDQWHHWNWAKPSASIQTPRAWDITQGSTNVIVAVIDSGLADLPEFTGRTVPGYNFAYDNGDTVDDFGHGTEVAGVLCANANNSTLGAGVDWNCRLMAVKVVTSTNTSLYSWWAQAIDYAVRNGCKVINFSLIGRDFNRTVQKSITNAIAAGVIFVTVSGNEGGPNIGFPGFLSASITVGGTDRDDQRAGFSNYGVTVDVVAPGQDVVTVGRSGNLEVVRGTSFSAPLVAGVCALLAATRPGLNQADARQLLCAGADDGVGDTSDAPGFDNYYGWGRLNAFNSLLLATTVVDQIRHTDNRIELSWVSPANASNKQPYQIEYKTTLTDVWISLTNANAFRYEFNRTYWTDDESQIDHPSGKKFYRVGLRKF